MEQVRGLQFARLQFAYEAKKGPKPLWFSINSEEGEERAGDAAFASLIRTNLKRLTPIELGVLTRHGRALTLRESGSTHRSCSQPGRPIPAKGQSHAENYF